jgi:hypothetical protein
MDIDRVVHRITRQDPDMLADVVRVLLTRHASPVFGAAKVVEHEVAAFNALRAIGYLSPGPDEYELVEKLSCTRMKARNLLYQVALRERNGAEGTDEELQRVFSSARIAKDGDLFLIEIPQPLTMDRLRSKVRSLGYLTDGSFSGSIAKIPERAILALLSELVDEETKDAVRKQFVHQGLTDTSFTGVARDVLKRYAGRFGGQAASSAVDNLAPMFGELFKGSVAGIAGLLERNAPSTNHENP